MSILVGDMPSLNKQLTRFAETLIAELPREAGDFVRSCGYIAGGCISSLIRGEPSRDVDVFFDAPEVKVKRVLGSLVATGRGRVSKSGHSVLYHTYGVYDLVQAVTGAPEQVVSGLDMRHVQLWFPVAEKKLYAHSHVALICAVQSKIEFTGSFAFGRLNTLRRAFKFAGRGYSIAPAEVASIARLLQGVDVDKEEAQFA